MCLSRSKTNGKRRPNLRERFVPHSLRHTITVNHSGGYARELSFHKMRTCPRAFRKPIRLAYYRLRTVPRCQHSRAQGRSALPRLDIKVRVFLIGRCFLYQMVKTGWTVARVHRRRSLPNAAPIQHLHDLALCFPVRDKPIVICRTVSTSASAIQSQPVS